jgi:DnaJ-domain-containing protein 1
MESLFQVDRGSCSTTQGNNEAISALETRRPGRAWQFVSEFQQLLGEDSEPDPLFFVDSWTLGMGAAVENFKQRRQAQADRDRESQAFREIDRLGTRALFEESDLYTEFVSSAPASTSSGTAGAAWQSPQEPSARTEYQTLRESDTFAQECSSLRTREPMTVERACQLLGVTPASTEKQAKAAYRRMVSQWHPDRLELCTEETRQFATERMAAINEAYHLLRSALLH